jgi:U4/U6.U5 tri-snRNP-associated protein 1
MRRSTPLCGSVLRRSLTSEFCITNPTFDCMADAESLSLEETNKIRISLGLAPLKPPSAETTSTAGEDGDVPPDDEKRAFDNLKALRAEQAKTADEAALRRRLQK